MEYALSHQQKKKAAALAARNLCYVMLVGSDYICVTHDRPAPNGSTCDKAQLPDGKARCPECGRTVNTRKARFGITVYQKHKLAVLSDHIDAQHMDRGSQEARRESLALGPHFGDYELDCPNSGQPVD